MAADPYWYADNRVWGDGVQTGGGASRANGFNGVNVTGNKYGLNGLNVTGNGNNASYSVQLLSVSLPVVVIPMPDMHAVMQSGNLYAYVMGNPVRYIDLFGTDYYIYYGKDQKFAANQYEKQLNKDYPGMPVHMIFVDNPDTFYLHFENMGNVNGQTVNIDGVIINLHGNPSNIFACDKEKIDLNKLNNSKYIPTLLLFVCNAGHFDDKNNVANQLLDLLYIGNVIAPDGTHYRYEFIGLFGLGASIKNYVKGDDIFDSHRKDNDRGSYGFISYSINSLGQKAYNFNVLNTMNENKIRAIDLFKYKHYFASGFKDFK